MKQVAEDLEKEIGGIVIHRTGATVLLYRGLTWSPSPEMPHDADTTEDVT